MGKERQRIFDETCQRYYPGQESRPLLLALGFVHPVIDGLVAELGLELNERKNIRTNGNCMTSASKVFAAGDSVSGASLVVNAIASGRKAAKEIDKFLKR
jgi:glutamate synthase (NADPH/NADH) small chain